MTRKSQGARCALLVLTICCLSGVSAFAQAAPPPIKMGLWESSVTTTMGGITIPPDVAAKMQAMGRPVPGGPHTTVTQSCMTPDQWDKAMADMNKQGDSKCTLTNKSMDAHHLSFDQSCTSSHGGTFSGHFEMQFDNDEHSHGTMNMKGTSSGGQPISIDATLTSHFVSADCGEVKPGEAKVKTQ